MSKSNAKRYLFGLGSGRFGNYGSKLHEEKKEEVAKGQLSYIEQVNFRYEDGKTQILKAIGEKDERRRG